MTYSSGGSSFGEPAAVHNNKQPVRGCTPEDGFGLFAPAIWKDHLLSFARNTAHIVGHGHLAELIDEVTHHDGEHLRTVEEEQEHQRALLAQAIQANQQAKAAMERLEKRALIKELEERQQGEESKALAQLKPAHDALRWKVSALSSQRWPGEEDEIQAKVTGVEQRLKDEEEAARAPIREKYLLEKQSLGLHDFVDEDYSTIPSSRQPTTLGGPRNSFGASAAGNQDFAAASANRYTFGPGQA